jgi:hypothetical protein
VGRTGGKVGIWETTISGSPNYAQSAPDLTIGVSLWPTQPNNNQNLASVASAITRASEDLDAAWEFARWWNAVPQLMGSYAGAGGSAPARWRLFEAPPFTTVAPRKLAMPGFTSPDGWTRPLVVRYAGLAEAMVPAPVDGFRGKIPPQQAVDESAQAGTAI